MAAISLTADSLILTATANDFGFETLFSRQVAALGRPGDRRRGPVHLRDAARTCSRHCARRDASVCTPAASSAATAARCATVRRGDRRPLAHHRKDPGDAPAGDPHALQGAGGPAGRSPARRRDRSGTAGRRARQLRPGTRARARRRHARPLPVRLGGARLARGAGAGHRAHRARATCRAAPPTWPATPRSSVPRSCWWASSARDEAAAELRSHADRALAAAFQLTCREPPRPTTAKTRYLADQQQILRTDREVSMPPISEAVAAALLAALRRRTGGGGHRDPVRIRQRGRAHRRGRHARSRSVSAGKRCCRSQEPLDLRDREGHGGDAQPA